MCLQRNQTELVKMKHFHQDLHPIFKDEVIASVHSESQLCSSVHKDPNHVFTQEQKIQSKVIRHV